MDDVKTEFDIIRVSMKIYASLTIRQLKFLEEYFKEVGICYALEYPPEVKRVQPTW